MSLLRINYLIRSYLIEYSISIWFSITNQRRHYGIHESHFVHFLNIHQYNAFFLMDQLASPLTRGHIHKHCASVYVTLRSTVARVGDTECTVGVGQRLSLAKEFIMYKSFQTRVFDFFHFYTSFLFHSSIPSAHTLVAHPRAQACIYIFFLFNLFI